MLMGLPTKKNPSGLYAHSCFLLPTLCAVAEKRSVRTHRGCRMGGSCGAIARKKAWERTRLVVRNVDVSIFG